MMVARFFKEQNPKAIIKFSLHVVSFKILLYYIKIIILMTNIKIFKYNNTLGFISDLLILILSPLAVFYHHIFLNTYSSIYYMIIFLLFICVTLSIYIKLYNWRNLTLSFSSFVFFSIVIIQLILYLFSISLLFNMLYSNNYTPIYLDNISKLSQYRYLFFSLITIFIISIFIFFKLSGKNIPYASSITYPYLKEEIRKILYTWNNGFIGVLCNKIIDFLYFSFWFRTFFFITHFILFSLTRLLSTALLFHCTFYHGDFLNFLYLTPIMFFIWVLSFFNYYFITFQHDAKNYILSLVSAKKPELPSTVFGVLKLDSTTPISFQLTEEAVSKGFYNSDMYNLTKEWYIQAELSAYLYIYFKLVYYLNYFILLSQIVIWCYITQIFFFPLTKEHFISSTWLIYWNYLNKLTARSYATQAHRVLPKHQKSLTELTEGVHINNHPALIDPIVTNPDNPKEILYEGQPTHGKGSPKNPSHPLHPSLDLQGNQKPQNFVPPTTITYIPKDYVYCEPIPGSQSFLNYPEVKTNLAKHTPQEENT